MEYYYDWAFITILNVKMAILPINAHYDYVFFQQERSVGKLYPKQKQNLKIMSEVAYDNCNRLKLFTGFIQYLIEENAAEPLKTRGCGSWFVRYCRGK